MKCYLCKNETIKLFEKNGYNIYKCSKCLLCQTDLKQNYHSFVAEHYSKGYFTGNPKQSAYVDYKDDKYLITKNLSCFLQHILPYKKNGKLLDVGCAMGYFLDIANQYGFETYGFDPSTYATDEAKKNHANRIKVGTIDKVKYPDNFFDVITLFDVFEHLENPLRDIQRVKKWLKKDGIIVIATGDTKSKMAKILNRRWTFYSTPQHLFFFNQENMTTLLEDANLKPVQWFRIGKWLSLRYVLHLARTTGESTLAQLLYFLFSRSFLGKMPLYLPLQDNMVAIIQKK